MQTVALSDQGKEALGAAQPSPHSGWAAACVHVPPVLSVAVAQQSGPEAIFTT